MKKDVVIIGAGPAGIFTALEMLKKGSRQSILIVEKGQAVENRHCLLSYHHRLLWGRRLFRWQAVPQLRGGR